MNSSPFASLNTKEIAIPGMAGQTAIIRQLGHTKLIEAQRASLHNPDSLRAELQALIDRTSAGPQATDPLVGFDAPTVVNLGVVSSSLGDAISSLDPGIVEDLAREILLFSMRSNGGRS